MREAIRALLYARRHVLDETRGPRFEISKEFVAHPHPNTSQIMQLPPVECEALLRSVTIAPFSDDDLITVRAVEVLEGGTRRANITPYTEGRPSPRTLAAHAFDVPVASGQSVVIHAVLARTAPVRYRGDWSEGGASIAGLGDREVRVSAAFEPHDSVLDRLLRAYAAAKLGDEKSADVLRALEKDPVVSTLLDVLLEREDELLRLASAASVTVSSGPE